MVGGDDGLPKVLLGPPHLHYGILSQSGPMWSFIHNDQSRVKLLKMHGNRTQDRTKIQWKTRQQSWDGDFKNMMKSMLENKENLKETETYFLSE